MKLHVARKVEVNNGFKHQFQMAEPVYLVPLNIIMGAEWNHPDRSDKDAIHVKRIAASMAEVNQLMPVYLCQLTKPIKEFLFMLMAGHNRHTAAMLRGDTHIKAIISNLDAATVYRHLQIHKGLSSSEKLFAFMKEPNTIDQYMRSAFTNMVGVVEKRLLTKMVAKKATYATYKQARKIALYCDSPNNIEFINLALEWLIDRKQTFAARIFMKNNRSKHDLWTAIINDQTLCSSVNRFNVE